MNKILRHKLLLALMVFTALISILPQRALAVAGTIRFEPGGSSVYVGQQITVRVVAKVGMLWPSGGATVGVLFPTSHFQAVGASSQGGALGGNNPTIGNGRVDFTVHNFLSGRAVNDEMLFTITFKALKPGNATLSFTPNTNVNNGPTTATAKTYSLSMQPCPTGQVGTPPNCTTPTPSPSPSPSPSSTPKPTPKPTTPAPTVAPSKTPAPTPSPTTTPEPSIEETPAPVIQSDGGLKIENVKTTITRQENKISWSLNRDGVDPKLTYGTSKTNLKSEATVVKLENNEYETVLPDLKPGTLYYFSIKAASSDQLQGATHSGSFTTRGYPVQLTIQQNGILAPGAKVKIGDRTFVANKDAIITTELSEGNFEAIITPTDSTESLTARFTVAKKTITGNTNPELQAFTLNALISTTSPGPGEGLIPLVIGGGVSLLLGIAGFIGFILFKRKRSQDSAAESIDGDLLAASYGPAISDARVNTPEPNLETQAASVAQPEAINDALPPGQPEIVPDPEIEPAQSEQSMYPMNEPSPTDLPLPPAPEYAVAPESVATQNPEEQPLPPPEELSYQVNAVEAIEAPATEPVENSNEEAAVYHAETGELDIIHHHTPSSQPPAASAYPSQTQGTTP